MSYSIRNALKWAFLWIQIAHLADQMGDAACAGHAHGKCKAAYREAKRLLRKCAPKDKQLKTLVSDLATVRALIEAAERPAPGIS